MGERRRSISVFWDYENARPLSDTCMVEISSRIRNILLPHGDIVSRKIYYDAQSPAEFKTNRTDLDMTGWTLVDCPKRQKKETLDKKIIVDMMFFIAYENPHDACICLISGDGDFCYSMNRIRDLGGYTILLYPDKITYHPLILNVHESHSWEKEILKKEKLDKKKMTQHLENNHDEDYLRTTDEEVMSVGSTVDDGKSEDDPDEIALIIFLNATHSAVSRAKDGERALDALIAEIWYKQMNPGDSGTVSQETKEWYKSTRKQAFDLKYINVYENKDTPGHVTRYSSLTDIGRRMIRDRAFSFS